MIEFITGILLTLSFVYVQKTYIDRNQHSISWPSFLKGSFFQPLRVYIREKLKGFKKTSYPLFQELDLEGQGIVLSLMTRGMRRKKALKKFATATKKESRDCIEITYSTGEKEIYERDYRTHHVKLNNKYLQERYGYVN